MSTDVPLARSLVTVASTVRDALDGSLYELIDDLTDATPAVTLRDEAGRLRQLLDRLVVRCDGAAELAEVHARYARAAIRTMVERIRDLRTDEPRRADALLVIEFVAAYRDGDDVTTDVLLDIVREVDPASDLTTLGDLREALREGDARRLVDRARELSRIVRAGARRSPRAAETLTDLAVLQVSGLDAEGDHDACLEVLAEHLERYPGARVRCEMVAMMLAHGRLDEAAAHARAAADDEPLGDGALALALVAEAEGDLTTAVECYRQAFPHWPVRRLAFTEALTLRAETGLMLRELAAARLGVGLPQRALSTCDEALAHGVRGPEPYPDEAVYRTRLEARRQLRAPAEESFEDTLEVAKRVVWSAFEDGRVVPERVDEAVALLRPVVASAQAPPLVGWYLAEACRLQGGLPGAPDPRAAAIEAERIWTDWTAREVDPDGPPPTTESWVYASGSQIALDLAYCLPDPAAPRELDRSVVARSWPAVHRIEKALVLDQTDPLTWAMADRALLATELADEAADVRRHGLELDPGNEQLLAETVFAHYAAIEPEAVLAADEVTGPLAGHGHALRAWACLQLLNPQGALDELALIRPGTGDQGWYLQLRWSALVGLGRTDEAEAALTELASSEPTDRNDVIRLVWAQALTGDTAGTRRALELLAGSRAPGVLRALVVADAALGEADAAHEHAARLHREADGPADVRHSTDLWRTCAAALRARHPAVRAAALLDEVAQRASSAPPVPSPTLDRLLDRYADDAVAHEALLAVRARRERLDGDLLAAQRTYGALRRTAFEPEATHAWHEVVRARLTAAVEAGDADLARELHDALATDDSSPFLTAAMAVAAAYDAVGDHERARQALAEWVDHPDTSVRAQIRLWLAMYSAAASPDEAFAWMERAAADSETMAEEGAPDPELDGRISARLAVLAAATGHSAETVTAFLVAALSDYRSVATEPAFALEWEIRRTLGFVPAADVTLVRECYDAACAVTGTESAPWGSDPPELVDA
ncbi:hypothetical protein KIN34_14630 [Cellulomonas sp. DKR-3]|uniref:Tetratricopeptide repeat protein n=1 Tax=Cellulomonas fulva TaxID=2835530 RepID=A0ABS5U288_9CELL|nr:hypothetical protein [Cellulomonas fulva]MBT0995519.1 hypothetical protein [Cellulomonas fulva]